jgi:DNA polymerase-3 subunit gamma/tau
MSYQVLALKYRPQTFDDVAGQSHVTTTLVNAVLQDRVAHAILFTGPRGTGKTTIARILAKAMNCAAGPTPTPCNHCKSCTEITAGHCADVFEIDGASNNSVDQIRDLRENVTYLPAAAPYKIYIIDEVHMLSTAAFNALLKTLEEPPEHVLFIFATTEVHKIPATILSRCQRHDLGRVPLETISGLLEKICTSEGFSVESQGLDLIALEADGSVRDALSLLDRMLSAAPETQISCDMVVDRLGILDRRIMNELTHALFEKDVPALISVVDRVNDTGVDLKKFYGDLITHVRHLNIIKTCGPDHPAVNLTADEKQRIHARVANLPDTYPGRLLQVLLADEDMVKRTAHTRIAIETVLFKLVQVRQGASIDRIIQQLDLLARQMKSGTSGPDPGPGPLPADRAADGPGVDAVDPPAPAYPTDAAPEPPVNGVRESAGPAPIQAPDIPRTWEGFLIRLKTRMPSLHGLLSRGRITSETENTLALSLSDCTDFDRKRLAGKQKELETRCRKFLGKTLTIHIASDTRPPALNGTGAEDIKARQAAAQHPLVQHAQDLFNGEIINL